MLWMQTLLQMAQTTQRGAHPSVAVKTPKAEARRGPGAPSPAVSLLSGPGALGPLF